MLIPGLLQSDLVIYKNIFSMTILIHQREKNIKMTGDFVLGLKLS